MQALQLEYLELTAATARLAAGEAEHDEALRELWVINGVLDYDLNSDLLNQCIARHRESGTIPRRYSDESLL